MIGEKQALQRLTQFHLLTSLIGLILVDNKYNLGLVSWSHVECKLLVQIMLFYFKHIYN